MMSDLARKMQGKVSGKQQLRRIGRGALQRIVDGTEPKMLRDIMANNDPEAVIEYIHTLRKDAIEAIKTIDLVEE